MSKNRARQRCRSLAFVADVYRIWFELRQQIMDAERKQAEATRRLHDVLSEGLSDLNRRTALEQHLDEERVRNRRRREWEARCSRLLELEQQADKELSDLRVQMARLSEVIAIRAQILAPLKELLRVLLWNTPKRMACRLSVLRLLNLAVFLAGRRRPALRDEWGAHLAGESGHNPVTWQKARQALGFVGSAVQFRLADAADLAWRPADAVLGSRTLSNLFVGGPVVVMLFAIVHHDGRFGLVADIQDAGELGAFLYGVIRVGRWWRGVKPPEPKARCARE